jgi:xylulokinase
MFLGIDLGTSSVKLVLIDEAQRMVGTATAPLSVSRLQPHHSEQDPHDWWAATKHAFFQLKEHHAKSLLGLRAIGLSGQMHGATLLDEQHRVIRPAILWDDMRSFKECDALLAREPRAHEITGNLIMPGFTAPKLMWLAKHEVEHFHAVHKVLLPKDYLRFKLSGDFSTDCSDASGTSWLDVKKRCWSQAMLDASGMKASQMPTLHEGSDVTGVVLPAIAAELGIPLNTQIIAGGGDNAASAVSVGVLKAGQAFLSVGTSGVYFVADDQYRPKPQAAIHTFCHCLPNLWHEMNVHLSAGSSVVWCAKLCNKPIEALVLEAEHSLLQQTPLFLPYLSGERTPHNNAHARGVFFGMDHNTGAASLMQSVLEGVAMNFAQSQQLLVNQGVAIDSVALVGGGAKSHYFAKLIASALGKPLQILHGSEVGGAFGAARLAWMGHMGANLSQLETPVCDVVIEPDARWRTYFQARLPAFEALYKSLESSFLHLQNIRN